MQPLHCPLGTECAQLIQAEADYNRLFNVSLDLLCIAGLDGYFKRVNPSWTRILGWSEAELLARPVETFMHPEDRERTLLARSGLARGVPVRGLENRYLCKDGSYRWLSWQSIVEPGASTVFAVARDITERRLWDQEQLIRSKLESTGILAGGIAHDFNNLLASLLLNLEMAGMNDSVPDERAHNLAHARQTIHAARALTQQLIAFSSGGKPARHTIDLRNLLEESLGIALRGSVVRGECRLARDLWPAEVDEEQIAQVIRNLVLNAREAMSAGGTVTLEATNAVLEAGHGGEDAPGDYVRITVTDEGPGIPAETLSKIFDPYFSTKQRGAQKGMGLGLTICRTIIENHGGTITVASPSQFGTTVTCYLPAVRKTTVAPVSTAHPAAPDARAKPATPERILVMDDEPWLRDTLGQILQRLGYAVEKAGAGEEAIALYERAKATGNPFSVVLLDLTVRGGMGGNETLQALQRRDPAVRAILMTGYSSEDAFREYRRQGFLGAIGKPFSSDALRTLLIDVLRADSDLLGIG